MLTKIVYEDDRLLVCHKPAGIATQTDRIGQPDVVSELKNYLRSPYVAVIHRLDQPVEGLLVFAKDKKTAAALSSQLTSHQLRKLYLAIVYGVPEGGCAQLTDYLLKEKGSNLSKVVDRQTPQAACAQLSYRLLEKLDEGRAALLEVELTTGRHHQIRVQLSHHGYPLLGDRKYGSQDSIAYSDRNNRSVVALCAYRLEFTHPGTKKRMSFQCVRPGEWGSV